MLFASRRLGPLLALLLVCIGPGLNQARAAPEDGIPDALKPWMAWTLKDHESELCIAINGVRTCVFPSALTLVADERGASFSLRVHVDQRALVTLPGSAEHFPLDVRSGKELLPVIERDGAPTLWLSAGTHTLTGRFDFAALPDTLQLPPQLASLDLRVKGVHVAFPKREASGLLWLKQSGDAGEEERLDLSVHRRIDDAMPLYVTTRLHVSAGGKAREVVLPNVLVPGTRPIELRAGLPVELTADGALRLQIQAGEHDFEIVAIRERDTSELVAPQAPAPWPERELWVLKTDEQLRHVEVSGPSQIDPARTDLAPDWRGLPTYVMAAKEPLKLETRRRGEPEPPPNQLSLRRTLWLDLDGDGYTVRDELGGTLQRGFRLDLLAAKLGHAVDHSEDQLVTQSAGRTGVELRRRAVDLQTEWRLDHGQRELPAVGYNEDVHSLAATLNLPPGFMLLGAEGVDEVAGTWLDSWDLFDFFFVLLVSLAVAKLAGKAFGLVALLALVLTHQDGDAPAVSWVLLLALSALLQALKSERFTKWLRVLWFFAIACVVITLLPFSVLQVRKALYLHLDQQAAPAWSFAAFKQEAPLEAPQDEAANMVAPAAPPAEPSMKRESAAQEASGAGVIGVLSKTDSREEESAEWLRGSADSYGSARVGGRAAQSKSRAYKVEVDPSAVVQTGPGLPSWNFRQFNLGWTGPVQKDQRIQLWLVPPPLTRAWSLCSVLFSGLLLLALVRAARRPPRRPPSVPPSAHAKESLASTFVGLFALALAGHAGTAHAQALPSQELLGELRTRLLEPPKCEPDCLSVASLFLRLDPARMSITAEVHAEARASYAAPGPLESWAPDKVLVDGKDALAALRSDDGFLRVLLTPGVHKVELSGPLPPSLAFTLALGDTPHHVRAEHKGFVIEGLRDDGRAESSLSIRREVQKSERGTSSTTQGLAQWFQVRRELELGIRFRLHTTVTRLGATSEGALVRVPLLPGEEVSEAGLSSERGSVVINLPRGERTVSYASSLSPVPELKLRAPEPAPNDGPLLAPISEVWVVAPSVLYRTSFEGIAPVLHVNAAGTYQPEYRPFPGESLTIRAARLSGAEGASTTTDNALVSFTPGTRLEQATLTLRIRTSRGSTERVVLPKDVQLHSVTVDGAARPARLQKDGKLEVRLDPGSHQVVVSMQRARGMEFAYQPFRVALERPLTNVTSEVQVPQGRWLLFARGPAWGPAVLFWGYLVVVLLCALALGQLPLTPLKPYQWMLLGLGLTQVEAPVALIIVGWLFAIAYRERRWPDHPTLFNLTQVALVGLTLAALGCLAYAVHSGLVVQPSMQVEGMGSSDQLLRWYSDRSGGAFPEVSVWSAPLWIYKALMLLWALWLAALVIRWLRWSLFSLRSGGGWQQRRRPGAPVVAAGPVPPVPHGPSEPPPGAPPDDVAPGPEGAGVP